MKSKIIFDFDGTLVDCAKHDYAIYCDTIKHIGEQYFTQMPFDRYWAVRRGGVELAHILSHTNTEHDNVKISNDLIHEYVTKRSELIDDALETYDHHLTLLPGVREALDYCVKKFDCYLVTKRANIFAVYRRCSALDIRKYFCGAYAANGDKPRVFRSLLPIEYSVGDTCDDVNVAKQFHNIKSIAVASGVRSHTLLRMHEPTHLIDDMTLLYKILCTT